MRHSLLTILPLCLATFACEGSKDKSQTAAPSPSATAKPTAAATATAASAVTPGGKISINSSFLKMENVELKIGSAYAVVEDDSIRVTLVSDNIEKIDCGHFWEGGKAVQKGQLAIELQTKGISYNVPFERKPGKYEGIGYTYYWNNDADTGTNSGNSAKKDAKTVLEITAMDDKSVKGSFTIQDEAKGTFTAKVCQ